MLARQTSKTLEVMQTLKEFMREPNPSTNGRVKEIERVDREDILTRPANYEIIFLKSFRFYP